MDTSKENILIIFGDAGINFYGGKQDRDLKRQLAKLPLTLFSIPCRRFNL
jgi:3-oxoacid CoA-transferase subunit A